MVVERNWAENRKVAFDQMSRLSARGRMFATQSEFIAIFLRSHVMLHFASRIGAVLILLLILRTCFAAETLPQNRNAVSTRLGDKTIRYGKSVGISPTEESLPVVCQRM